MIEIRQRKLIFALLALLLILAGCKSESPTAPPPIGGGTTPGGGTPPTTATITLTATNLNPLVNSTTVITAEIRIDGQPAPNGTAVQFNTSAGNFVENGGLSILRTTTDGRASVTLTAAGAGTARVTATVGSPPTTREIIITFVASPVVPPPPSTSPTITAVTPASGSPAGGDQVVITGSNFRTPIRVLFGSRPAFVVSSTATQITVLTPSVNVATGQTLVSDVTVIVEAGTPTEQQVVRAQAFTFGAAVLTPTITVLNPSTGPSLGGTRITITGSGFQAPVQVTFGGTSAGAGGPLNSQVELQVISVNFSVIVAMTPEQRLIDPGLSGNNGSVNVRVLNINSNKDAVLTNGFRYLPRMAITTVRGTEGPFTGGTRMTIDGIGFDQPLAVVAAGVGAQVISVSGTQVVAITSPVQVRGCSDVSGAIIVTNTDNGDSASGPNFIYRVPTPVITFISNPNQVGGTATIRVLNAQGLGRITVGGVGVNITAQVDNPDGTTTFTVQIPSTVRLQTTPCASGGLAPVPTAFDVIYTNLVTGCTVTSTNGMTVEPPATPAMFLNPGAFQPFSATITPATVGPPPVAATVTPSASQTLFIVNTGAQCPTSAPCPLTITNISTAGAGCARFGVAAPPIPPNIDLNQCESVPIIVQYNGQAVPATETCTLTITTNAGVRNLLLVGTSQ